ncbi:potassium channel family protein [Thiohalobacter thiocyanaticus]|uniref:Trk system potassium uptake protein TrkA n=1 Tax=Thiohalobacter thiocyanaticus TaxID=585455 RepID=A0A426QH53_9GAMM|nr:TrkA family potassium uptake protein [Thiohalobacter thiocyanaticus]RRQ21060.1 TrkA family potassium uptake protein [Thiohalobacter thiocyanaticus]
MRTVVIGAGKISTLTAQQLLKQGHEVVIIEKDKARIDELSNELAAGFIHGDGSKPAILREADPAATDFLFTLTGNDQSNIIASLVGRSLGFSRVVTRIDDPAYEHICIELGLSELVVPDYTIARYLTDIVAGKNPLELSAMVKGNARIFSFVAREDDEVAVADLKLPTESRVMFLYRNEKFIIPDMDTTLKKGDEVVVIAHSKVLPDLESRWNPQAENGP